MWTQIVGAGVVLASLGVAHADGVDETSARQIASRWIDGVHAGKTSVALLGTPTARVHGVPCKIHDATGRAEVAKAIPAWRYCMPFSFPMWKTVATGADWRDVETRVDDESVGSLRVRVGRDGLIRDVAIEWSQGGR